MTTIEITLPDQLAQEALQAGLLSPMVVEELLRERLRKQRVAELFEAMDRTHAMDDAPMSLEEIQEEVRAARADRRAKDQR